MNTLDIDELSKAAIRAQNATSGIIVLAALLTVAAEASEDRPGFQEKIPSFSEISSLYEILAMGADEAISSVRISLREYEEARTAPPGRKKQ